MAKFFVECPKCHSYLEAKSGIWGTKEITCSCGEHIILRGKDAQKGNKACPNCRNNVVYDLVRSADAACPICGTALFSADALIQGISFVCHRCGQTLRAAGNEEDILVCPFCGAKNSVKRGVFAQEQKRSAEATVIQYEGDSETIVWRHPIQDFSAGSTLIVHHNQLAIFFRDGLMLNTFHPGKHVLTEALLPKSSSENGALPHHSKIYFVNNAVQVGLKWGANPSLHDPGSEIHVTLHSHGHFNLQIENPRKLIGKLVGTTETLTRDKLFEARGYFRSSVCSAVKSNMAQVISENGISILRVDSEMARISQLLTDSLSDLFCDYGMVITEINIEDIGIPTREEEPYFWKMKDQIGERATTIRQNEINILREQGKRMVKIMNAESDLSMRKLPPEDKP